MRFRIITWAGIAIGMLLLNSAEARPIGLVKPAAALSTSAFQIVGNGIYPVSGSA